MFQSPKEPSDSTARNTPRLDREDRCFAEGISRRFAGTKAFPNGFVLTLHPDRIEDPLYWRRPSRVFVNSMSDLFHTDIPTDYLTKRPGPMRAFITAREKAKAAYAAQFDDCPTPEMRDSPAARQARHRAANPPANIWLGVSVEDQKTAELRITQLLDTPAAVRFISAEPLLGPVDLSDLLLRRCPCCHGEPHGEPFDDGACGPCDDEGCDGGFMRGVDWVIVGGESGPGARPMDLDWAKDIVTQCRQEHVPVFVKQLGSAVGRQHKNIERFPRALHVRQFPRLAPAPTAAAVMAGRA